MNIIGCIPVYNEADLIRQAVTSLQGNCDRIVVIDGAYQDFPLIGNSPCSTDGTMDIAKDMNVEVRTVTEPWIDQATKRSAFFEYGELGDWYLMLDADETLEGVFVPEPDQDAYRISCWNFGNVRVSQEIFRIFRHVHGIRIHGCHDGLFHGQVFIHPRTCPVIDGCQIRHHQDMRTKERKRISSTYYAKQYFQEKQFRQQRQVP